MTRASIPFLSIHQGVVFYADFIQGAGALWFFDSARTFVALLKVAVGAITPLIG
jgi:hypothetical protein